jgi:very-short-patch-repair endonuclease
MDKIECKMCGKKIGTKGISHHLRMLHDTVFMDYVTENLDDFPNYRPCLICGTISTGETCSYKCMGKLRESWVGEKASHFGHKHSDETKKKISEIRKKQGNFKTGIKLSAETKQKISNTRIERGVAKGEKNGMYGKTHTPEAIKKIMTKRPMNKLEKRVSEILTEAGIKFHFQYFLNRDGICKSYDFKIKGKSLLIEIDGDYWHGGPASKKYKAFHELDKTQRNDEFKNEFAEDNGFEIYRFWESQIKTNPNIILETIHV